MNPKPIINDLTKPDIHEDAQPTINESTDDALDEQLRVAGIVDAQVSLLRHLCRQVAESWRASHLEGQCTPESKCNDKIGPPV